MIKLRTIVAVSVVTLAAASSMLPGQITIVRNRKSAGPSSAPTVPSTLPTARLLRRDANEEMQKWFARQGELRERELKRFDAEIAAAKTKYKSLATDTSREGRARSKEQRDLVNKLEQDKRIASKDRSTLYFESFKMKGQDEERDRYVGSFRAVEFDPTRMAINPRDTADVGAKLADIGTGEQEIRIGALGTIPWKITVISVAGDGKFVGRCHDEVIWFSGWPTKGMVDASVTEVSGPLLIAGTKQYDDSAGGRRTVWEVKPFREADCFAGGQ